jgi:putative membrane protein
VRRLSVAMALILVSAPAPAHAHIVAPAAGTAWMVAALVVTAALYVAGLARLWRAASLGRGIHRRDAVAFAGGWIVLAMALIGPLDAWTAHSFAAHMLQHEALMLVAAPLLVRGRPLAVWTWALSRRGRLRARSMIALSAWRRAWQGFTRPLGATIVQLIALFVWHLPALFDFAATHAPVHALQHVSFLAAALCFWWSVRAPSGATDASAGIAIACLFVTMIASGALGAMLTFAPAPWYRAYGELPLPWASSAVEDQQLGGLLMWVPGGTVYLIAALLHAWRLLARVPSHPGVTGSVAPSGATR